MNIHKAFAQNLRTQCTRVGTIADVCRGSSVNRQQFNRYLSGAAIPNARTLARICEFLGIEETQLFLADPHVAQLVGTNGTRQSSQRASSGLGFNELIATVRQNLTVVQNSGPKVEPIRLAESAYYCFIPLQNFDGFVVRSLILVRHNPTTVQFHRYTRFKSPTLSGSDVAVGKHFGYVHSDTSQHYFVGINRLPPNNLSFIAVEQRVVPGGSLSPGLAIMQGGKGPFACRICIQDLGKSISITKNAMKNVGIVALDDPTINPMVARLLRQPSSNSSSQLGSASLEEALVSAYTT